MTRNDVLESALRLQREGTPYALVTVLRVAAPTSAQPGDKAVVTAGGAITGWIGGGCAQPVVVRTVRQALADGKAQLIRIAPDDQRGSDADEAQRRPARGVVQLGDVLEFGMACHSGGTLELFIDPILPQPQLVIFGASPVAVALSQLAPRVGFAVTVVAHGPAAASGGSGAGAASAASDFPDAMRVLADDDAGEVARAAPHRSYVVVATQGRRDLQALRAALVLEARQVSLVASARKAGVLKDSLRASGADAAAVDAIVAPAGYPIAASTPEEIALSVLAALVAHRHDSTGASSATNTDIAATPAAAAVATGAATTADTPATAMMVETIAEMVSATMTVSHETATQSAAPAEGATTITAVARMRKPAGGSCCGGG